MTVKPQSIDADPFLITKYSGGRGGYIHVEHSNRRYRAICSATCNKENICLFSRQTHPSCYWLILLVFFFAVVVRTYYTIFKLFWVLHHAENTFRKICTTHFSTQNRFYWGQLCFQFTTCRTGRCLFCLNKHLRLDILKSKSVMQSSAIFSHDK